MMLQFEFNQRIGEESSYEDYEFANSVYMESTLDKDKFCECWRDVRDNELFLDIFKMYKMLKQTNKQLEEYYGY